MKTWEEELEPFRQRKGINRKRLERLYDPSVEISNYEFQHMNLDQYLEVRDKRQIERERRGKVKIWQVI
jgi:hypothetical protein